MNATKTTTTLKAAKAAWKLAQTEWNEANQNEGGWKWTNTRMTDGFFYGESEMAGRMQDHVNTTNEYYMAGTGYHLEADGQTETRFNYRGENFGRAVLKVKLVKNA